MHKGFFGRLIVCGLFVGLGFSALAARLFIVQVRDRERLVAYAEKQLRRTLRVRAKRGEILDARGRPLAVSMNAPSLYANPREVNNPADTSRALSKILGVPRRGIYKKLSGGKRYVWLRRKLAPGEKRKILDLNLPGLGFVTESRRFYPKRELASSLLGFVGVDDNGLAGMELAFESEMRGRAGRIRIERDARGRSVHPESAVVVPTRSGADVRLTVDEVLQYIVEKELRLQLKRAGARRAVGVMVEPATGRILAMATVPGFNPNAYGRYRPELWKQGAVQDIYEPGSTFKLVTAAAYLAAGKSLQKRFFAEEGRYPIGVGSFVLRDHKKYGWLTAEEIIVKSSNIGVYKMAKVIGPNRLYRMARRFGFGSRSGVDFPGEAKGILRPPKRWSRTSLAAVPMGQEIAVTPLQMVMAAAAIANDGSMPPVHIVDGIVRNGNMIRRPDLAAPKRVISRRVARTLGRIMRKVVTEGTGASAEVPGYGAAGKTGTAQKVEPGARTYSKDKFVTSFVGFVPYKNPRIALLVVFDEGKTKGGAWGGTVAAPVWRRIAWQSMRYLRVPPKGAVVVALRDEIFPSTGLPRAEKVSFGEKVFGWVEGVREALHGKRLPLRELEPAR